MKKEPREDKKVVKMPKFTPDRFYVLDGGFNTRLAQYEPSAANGEDPLWGGSATLRNPGAVRKAHRDFIEAGAQIIETNTYQTSPELFLRHLGSEFQEVPPIVGALEMYETAARLAREAAEGTETLVAGSVGPYGACLGDGSEYTGSYVTESKIDAEGLEKWHFERIKRLEEAGVDLLAVETIPSVVEALAVLNVVEKFPDAKCWISFQCRDGERTARGEMFDDVVRQVLSHPAASTRLLAIGVNCCDPDHVVPLLRLANEVNDWRQWKGKLSFVKVPYVVYPNSGERYDADSKTFTGKARENTACLVAEWMDLGANVIGGCCRTGPEGISEIKEALAEHILDALVCRRENFERDNREDLDELVKRLRVKEVKGRKKKKREQESVEAGAKGSLEDCLRQDWTMVPGYMTQSEISEELKSIMKALEKS